MSYDEMQELDQCLVSFEEVRLTLNDLFKEQSLVCAIEDFSIFPDMISLEEPSYRTGAFTPLKHMRDGVGDVVSDVGDTVVDKLKNVALKTPGFLIKLSKSILEHASKTLAYMGSLTSKILATGYPLMGKVINDAKGVLDNLSDVTFKSGPIKVSGSDDYLTIDGKVNKPNQILKQVSLIATIQKDLLSSDKLNTFDSYSDQIFNVYGQSLKTKKVDHLVFVMSIMGLLTNPASVVGLVFKKVLERSNPKVGANIDRITKVAGGAYMGTGALMLGMGNAGIAYQKQMAVGKLSLSTLPKFKPLYPFCNQQVSTDPTSFYDVYQSPMLLGNYRFTVRDYKDTLNSQMKGGIGKVGAGFVKVKQKVEDQEILALTRRDIEVICKSVIDMMQNAQVYCKRWETFYQSYEKQFQKMSKLVLEVHDGQGSLVTEYTRYSYKNSLNLLLGSLWSNCFGTDNGFIRYHLKLSMCLLKYCRASIESKESVD